MGEHSRRLRHTENADQLFVYNLDYYDYDQPITFEGEAAEFDQEITTTSSSNGTKPRPASKTPIIEFDPTPIPESAKDPLRPSDFKGHHRRMEREEKRIQQSDRQQLLVDFEKVTTQKEQLLAPDWRIHIGSIVKIDDFHDSTEVEKKRRLAIEEMDLFLFRFQKLKKQDKESRDQKSSHVETNTKKRKSKSKSKLKKPKKPKLEPKVTKPVKTEVTNDCAISSDSESDDGALTISIRPTAFGYCVPPQKYRPTEFDIPNSWKSLKQKLYSFAFNSK